MDLKEKLDILEILKRLEDSDERKKLIDENIESIKKFMLRLDGALDSD